MRRICWLLPALLLAACGGQEDMDSYVAQTKARPPIPIEPLPELKPFAPCTTSNASCAAPSWFLSLRRRSEVQALPRPSRIVLRP